MRVNFWNKLWGEGNIGFHQAYIHAALEKYWPTLEPGTTVLVPLCGKTLDLLWLEERGLDVVGVEFVESAVLDFFKENNLSWNKTEEYGHPCYRASDRNICIFASDFIQLANDYEGPPLASLYDRAALVALPEDMRPAYVAACRKLLTETPQGLHVTLNYEPESMEGPPFSVPPEAVRQLWQNELELVEQVDMLASMPRAVALGVQSLEEHFWVFRQPGQ